MSIKPRMIFGDEDEMSPQLETAFENLNKFNESIAKLKPVFRK